MPNDPIGWAIMFGFFLGFPVALGLGWQIGWGRGFEAARREYRKAGYPG